MEVNPHVRPCCPLWRASRRAYARWQNRPPSPGRNQGRSSRRGHSLTFGSIPVCLIFEIFFKQARCLPDEVDLAKIEMLCPFSGGLCKECPQYRGRHYYLCFCQKYRGYLGNSGQRSGKIRVKKRKSREFEMPPVLAPSPKWLVLNEFVERVKK